MIHQSGLHPSLLCDIAPHEELVKLASAATDSQYITGVPLEYHVAAAIQRKLRVPKARVAAMEVPADVLSDEFKHFLHLVLVLKHTHFCCHTCLHRNKGKTGCCLAMPAVHALEETTILQINHGIGNDVDGLSFRCKNRYADGAKICNENN